MHGGIILYINMSAKKVIEIAKAFEKKAMSKHAVEIKKKSNEINHLLGQILQAYMKEESQRGSVEKVVSFFTDFTYAGIVDSLDDIKSDLESILKKM